MKEKLAVGFVLAVVLLSMIAVSHAPFDMPSAAEVKAANALSPLPVEFGAGVYFTAQRSAKSAIPATSKDVETDGALSPKPTAAAADDTGARFGADANAATLPWARFSADANAAALPWARYGADANAAALPWARFSADASAAALPWARFGADASAAAMPWARFGADASAAAMPWARFGAGVNAAASAIAEQTALAAASTAKTPAPPETPSLQGAPDHDAEASAPLIAAEASEAAQTEPRVSAEAFASAGMKPSAATAAVYKGRAVSIPVLNYHSVDYDPGNIVVITPEKLDEQMAFLSENGYNPLKLEDFFLILEGKLEPPEKPVLLTFDDGYADNYKNAMPIMKKYGFRATMFMSPGTIGQDWYVNWEQAEEMKEAGWDIQPHGMTHPHLPRLSAEDQANEIVEARKQIEEHLGEKADVFCYPYGEFNDDTLQILEKNNFRYAFTIQQGLTDVSQHKFKLKRIFVNGEDSLKTWKRRLTGK